MGGRTGGGGRVRAAIGFIPKLMNGMSVVLVRDFKADVIWPK